MQPKEFRMTENVVQDSPSDPKTVVHTNKKGVPKSGTPFLKSSLDKAEGTASICRPLPMPRASNSTST
jgi:hypothetical protein